MTVKYQLSIYQITACYIFVIIAAREVQNGQHCRFQTINNKYRRWKFKNRTISLNFFFYYHRIVLILWRKLVREIKNEFVIFFIDNNITKCILNYEKSAKYTLNPGTSAPGDWQNDLLFFFFFFFFLWTLLSTICPRFSAPSATNKYAKAEKSALLAAHSHYYTDVD